MTSYVFWCSGCKERHAGECPINWPGPRPGAKYVVEKRMLDSDSWVRLTWEFEVLEVVTGRVTVQDRNGNVCRINPHYWDQDGLHELVRSDVIVTRMVPL